MTDYPPDLIETMGYLIWCLQEGYSKPENRLGHNWFGDQVLHEDDIVERAALRRTATDVLDALASWCDGDLYDPATGQRVTATEAPCEGCRGMTVSHSSVAHGPPSEWAFTLTRKDQT